MRDLLATPMFSLLKATMEAHGEAIKAAEMIHLTAPATVEGVLAIGQLEAAFLDVGVRYRRRLFTPRHHLPRDAPAAWSVEATGLTVVVDVEEATWSVDDMASTEHIHLVPLTTTVEMGAKHRTFSGAVDPVLQAAALAALVAPGGRRVRKLRPFVSLGLWSRSALETNMDPIHTTVLNHLKEEGTLRVVPLPEVPSPATGMMPGLSERQLRRLAKVWPTMDVDQRSMAISELLLPCLTESELSTPRLEELTWHRMLVGDEHMDLASQLHLVKQAWPEEADASRLYASKLLDRWLGTGRFSAEGQATD